MNDSNIILFFDLTSGRQKIRATRKLKKKKKIHASHHILSNDQKFQRLQRTSSAATGLFNLDRITWFCALRGRSWSILLPLILWNIFHDLIHSAQPLHRPFCSNYFSYFHSFFQQLFLFLFVFLGNLFFYILFSIRYFFHFFFLFLFSCKFSEIFSSHFFFQLFFSLFHFEVQRWRDFYCIIMQAYTK